MSLKTVLQSTYLDNNKAKKSMRNSGYILDEELSNDKTKTYYNPTNKKLLIGLRGSNDFEDLKTDLYLGVGGKINKTNRFRESAKSIEKAKSKYNTDSAILTGHSLGGSLASSLGSTNDEIIAYNKFVNPFDDLTKTKMNEKSFRSRDDYISVFDKNAKTVNSLNGVKKYIIPQYSTLGGILQHSTNYLTDEKI